LKISELLKLFENEDPRVYWIEQINELYPNWPFDERYKLISWEQPETTKDVDTEFGIFKLQPSTTNPSAIAVEYLEIHPKQSIQLYTRIVENLKKMVVDGGYDFELNPKNVVGMGKY